ncbi:U6 snRNA-associated Sm-like protein LSm4 isoform X1 [Xenopus laevis]|uniref:U6 snRNA-associated Sm-like protein LSm4 n=1 Tax=Xenopus laevis TaxID=8355 RepID=A0A8J0V0N1_XENLA|nr:U6 snRNA-associated Sm-like protein LSm4 isoform X1 [Xenopus laevis]
MQRSDPTNRGFVRFSDHVWRVSTFFVRRRSVVWSIKQLPLSLLKTAQNHPMLVELKNGETYNGHLVSCDNWMNINLREVICTSRDGDKFWRMPECYIRGSTIKYLRIPDEIIDMVKEEVMSKGRGRGGMQQQKQMKGRGAGGGGRGVFGGRGRGTPGGGRGQQDKKPGRQSGKQ